MERQNLEERFGSYNELRWFVENEEWARREKDSLRRRRKPFSLQTMDWLFGRLLETAILATGNSMPEIANLCYANMRILLSKWPMPPSNTLRFLDRLLQYRQEASHPQVAKVIANTLVIIDEVLAKAGADLSRPRSKGGPRKLEGPRS